MFSSLRVKIAFGYIVLMIINLAVSIWAIIVFSRLGVSVGDILRENYQSVLASSNMAKAIENQDKAQQAMARGSAAAGHEEFYRNRDIFYFWYQRALERASNPREMKPLDDIGNGYRQYVARSNSLEGVLRRDGPSAAQRYLAAEIKPLSDKLKNDSFALLELNQSAMYDAYETTQRTATDATYGVVAAVLLAVMLSIFFSVQFSRFIIEPAEKLTERVKQIGEGKYDLTIDVRTSDEIGELGREFNRMTGRLRRYEQLNIEKILSEKRKSEAIVESISDPIIVTDASNNVALLNEASCLLFGVTEEGSLGKPLASVIADRRILELVDAARDSRNGGAEKRYPHLTFTLGDHTLFFKPRLTKIGAHAGDSMFGIVTILQDITQFKELDKLKSDFMATVSHEFRTPLTSVNMSIDILGQKLLGPLNEKQGDLLNSAKDDCRRLTKLVKELLELSRLESKKITMVEETLDIGAIIEFSLKPLQLPFQEKGVRLVLEVPPNLPSFTGDQQQISWVITNILNNALRYTESGGTVTIGADADEEEITLSIADTGRGIPKQYIGTIFDKFIQVKSVYDATPGSVGLGLSIAKEIIELYGGRIWVESEVGVGSTFRFTLPLRRRIAAAGTEAGGEHA